MDTNSLRESLSRFEKRHPILMLMIYLCALLYGSYTLYVALHTGVVDSYATAKHYNQAKDPGDF